MKRMIHVLLVVSLLVITLAVVASAEATSGICGDNLTWTFADKTLTISGTGDMYDYEENGAPWEGLRGVNKWVIEDGVTSIGNNAFNTSRRAMYGTVAASVKKIGSKAFANAHCMTYFLGSAPEIAADAFQNAHGVCCYVFGWELSNLQSYGGTQFWNKGWLEQQPTTKTVYGMNERIKPEDYQFKAVFSGVNTIDYTPQTFQVGSYDHSAPGEKTVTVSADGHEFTHTYYVTDGQSHLDAVEVELRDVQHYTGRSIKPEPKVTVGRLTLIKDVHYSLSYKNNTEVGTKAEVTITGIGEWEGLSKTTYFTILKRDISEGSARAGRIPFCGMPVTPDVTVYLDGYNLTAGEDYVVYYENNVNMGTGTFRAVGIGNYYGSISGTFQIGDKEYYDETLNGAYNGQADETLDTEQYHYQEVIWAPGPFKGSINSTVGSNARSHVAFYQLYHIVGEEAVLIHEEQSEYGSATETEFVYDFSHVYEGSADKGGEVYMLSYSWVDSHYSVYSGICAIIIPAKVPEATQMAVEAVEGIGDFRYAYLTAHGLDGNVGDETWTSSNPAVATVEDGVVAMKKTGTVTFTAQYGELSASVSLMILPEDLTKGKILRYDAETGKTCVYYDGYLLEEGTDYTMSVDVKGNMTEVTVTGINLFEGQLVQQFDAEGQPVGHSHGFNHNCDSTCGGCDYVRAVVHTYSTQWSKDKTHHWHYCIVCGETDDRLEHTVSAYNPDVCTVCGLLNIPGDLNGDAILNEDDAVYLLRHVLMPDQFPVTQQTEYTGDGKIDEDDAIYLLRHVLMPEQFPL